MFYLLVKFGIFKDELSWPHCGVTGISRLGFGESPLNVNEFQLFPDYSIDLNYYMILIIIWSFGQEIFPGYQNYDMIPPVWSSWSSLQFLSFTRQNESDEAGEDGGFTTWGEAAPQRHHGFQLAGMIWILESPKRWNHEPASSMKNIGWWFGTFKIMVIWIGILMVIQWWLTLW